MEETKELLKRVKEIEEEGKKVIREEQLKRERKDKKEKELELLEKEYKEIEEELETYIKASRLLGEVSDENTRITLDKITVVINKALGLLFRGEEIKVEIKKEIYRKVYPHFKVYLRIGDREMTFKQNGTGLAQVVSFLFTISLIDARGGRKLLVMDELLNGLHPDAKYIVKGIMESLSGRFQFVVVEYGLDVGKEYRVVREKEKSVVMEYEEGTYYKDVMKKEE